MEASQKQLEDQHLHIAGWPEAHFGSDVRMLAFRERFKQRGYFTIAEHELPIPAGLRDLTSQILSNGRTTSTVDNSRRATFLERGKALLSPGEAFRSEMSDPRLSRWIAEVTGWICTPGDAVLAEYEPKMSLNTHRDSSGLNPIVCSLIRQNEYSGPPVLEVYDSVTAHFQKVEFAPDHWVMLHGWVPHRITPVPSLRRTMVLGFRPIEVDAFFNESMKLF